MIFNYAIFKRDAFLNTRIPSIVKKQFAALAKSKGKTSSEYVLELVLQELDREGIIINQKK